MKINWTPELITQICKGNLVHPGSIAITGFSIDSRSIKPGNIYVALSGESFNGHKFVKSALENGASGAIVSEEIQDFNQTGFLIRVKDCLEALQTCASYYRNNHQGCFIGVTGSNGKTTTRSMLTHLLSEKHRCSSTSGNLNNHIGLPLTILGTPHDAEYVVLEMGMNHAGEIRDLCRIASPDSSLVSNIGPAHIGILGSLENIARAKAEIFENMPPLSPTVAPADTEFGEMFRSIAGESLKTFGQSEKADYRLGNLKMTLENVSFDLSHQGLIVNCKLPLAGQHNAFNAAAALAIFHTLGFDLIAGSKRLETFTAVNARMEKIEKDGINILLDCYNANPGSMAEALKFLSICPGNRIAVLGDMRELGEKSLELHSSIGTLAGSLKPELLITVGEDAKAIAAAAIDSGMRSDSVIALNSNDQAAELLKGKLKTGATVLFKASRGMHFEKIVRNIWPELAEDLH